MLATLTTLPVSASLLAGALAVLTAVLAPLIALGVVLLLPFSDRLTQGALLATWTSYLLLVGSLL